MKPREIAISVLSAHCRQGDFVESRLEQALAKHPLPAPDRRLLQELVYGVVRWQATLDWLIGQKTAVRAQTSLIQALLRLGLYQLFWLDRVPGYAAINETVEIAKQRGLGRQAGFINALLRAYERERAKTMLLLAELKVHEPHLGYSHPHWLCNRWLQQWGPEQLIQLLEWNNSPPPTFARLNTLRADAAQLTTLWSSEEVQFKERAWDWTGAGLVFELEMHPWLGQLSSFQQGWFYVQDPSTLLAVQELNPQPGETVLDLCAAPGGKTTFIAQRMANRGLLVAHDQNPQRLALALANCARLGVTCVETLTPTFNQKSKIKNQKFDRVLVDAPCSNTGVMRRRVELRWRLRPRELARLQATQRNLLDQAARFVRPGGTLVYSTCSLEAEENERVIQAFLSEHTNFGQENQRQLLPFIHGVDGAYVARLRPE